MSSIYSRRAVLGAGIGGALGWAAAANATVTPTQTEGPFFPTRPQADTDLDLTQIQGHSARAAGKVTYVSGRVLDAGGRPVEGALIDVWQANTHGRYDHESDTSTAPLDPHFQGWGRIITDREGRYAIKTIMPGAYAVDGEWQRPPHIHFKVARRGFHELTTQMYFAGHELNGPDRLLNALSEAEQALLLVSFGPGGPEDEAGSQRGEFDLFLRKV